MKTAAQNRAGWRRVRVTSQTAGCKRNLRWKACEWSSRRRPLLVTTRSSSSGIAGNSTERKRERERERERLQHRTVQTEVTAVLVLVVDPPTLPDFVTTSRPSCPEVWCQHVFVVRNVDQDNAHDQVWRRHGRRCRGVQVFEASGLPRHVANHVQQAWGSPMRIGLPDWVAVSVCTS